MFPLVIMAAGMSSRYQKSKQLECLIDNYNLVDFSIYDALKVGFKKIILIVREEQKITFTQKYQILIKKQLLNLCIQKLALQYFSCHPKKETLGNRSLCLFIKRYSKNFICNYQLRRFLWQR